MKTIYNKKRRGQLSLFNNTCILFILIQFIGCKCGNKPNEEGAEVGREGVTQQTTPQTTQQPEETKPTLILTGPIVVKSNPTAFAPTIIILELEVTNGTLNTNDYKLEAIDLKNYQQSYYAMEQTPADYHTKVSGTNGKTLLGLTGAPILTKNDKIDLNIPVVISKWYTSYDEGTAEGLEVPFSGSAEFQFAILDKTGNTVAGPVEVQWTRDS